MLPGGTTTNNEQGKIVLLSLWAVGRLSFATINQVDKSLNKGMVGSDVYLCFKRSLNMAEKISYQVLLEEDPSQCLNVNFKKKLL